MSSKKLPVLHASLIVINLYNNFDIGMYFARCLFQRFFTTKSNPKTSQMMYVFCVCSFVFSSSSFMIGMTNIIKHFLVWKSFLKLQNFRLATEILLW